MSAPLDQGGPWEPIGPRDGGFDPDRLAAAVAAAARAETAWPRDIATALAQGTFELPPRNAILGPTRPRGPAGGVVLRGGRLVAEWGAPARPDMSFSIAKSYLAVLAGLAVDDGLIADIDRPVAELVDDGGFAGAHNGAITWRHLLQQTSEWEGTVWDKPDLVDRHRRVGAGSDNSRKGTHRDLQPPGRFWEYNDVRVNRLSLALMRVWRRSLPAVLAERVMRPIGASDTWSWQPYRNAGVEVDGRMVMGVPGGSHWGGGLWMSARDHARLGLLIARGGAWGGRQLLSRGWIERMLTPCDIQPTYGCLWWLNTGRAYLPAVPATSVFAIGAGQSLIWVDPALDLVAVLRWIDGARADELAGWFVAALR